MNLIEIFIIIIVHWIADFVLQTDKQAKGKSKKWSDLLSHTWNYSQIWWLVGTILIVINLFYPYFTYKPFTLLFFFLITFVCHTITDYFTSRLNSKLWTEGKVHKFFVSVGFDQVLHYIQLFTTYWILAGKN